MPFGVCSDCDHCYVIDARPSRHWNCPLCHQPLREIPREEALAHLRLRGKRPQPEPAPDRPAARKPRSTHRSTVGTQHPGPNVSGNAACLPGPAPASFVEIRHRVTGQLLCRVTGDTLAGADLTGADLRGAGLHRAILTEALLCGANLTGADLSEARLERAMFSDAVLTDTDLRGASLAGAALHGCDLIEALLNPPFSGIPLYDDNTRWPDGFAPDVLRHGEWQENPPGPSHMASSAEDPICPGEPLPRSEATLYMWGYTPPQSRIVRDVAEPTAAAHGFARAAGWDEQRPGAWAKELRVSDRLSMALQELIPILSGDAAVVGWRLGTAGPDGSGLLPKAEEQRLTTPCLSD
jgi:pentapeptide repeat protein